MASRQDIKLALLISKLIHRIIIMDREEKSCQGVTLSQHYTLDVLLRRHELTMKDLSQELNLAISTLTRIVDILVRDGLIQRRSSPSDRRKVLVTLSEKGRKKADHLRRCTQRFWAKILDSVPEENKDDLAYQIKMLLNAIGGEAMVCHGQAKRQKSTETRDDHV
jgi:DNA-binding MarR family transcriptional regulator